MRVGDIVPIASKATSGDKGKFDASVKGFVIGAVPDRGGRPTEGRAAQAAANMPSWKPRSAASTLLLCLLCCACCAMPAVPLLQEAAHLLDLKLVAVWHRSKC